MIVKNVWFFRTICYVRRHLVLFLLLFVGMMEKGWTQKVLRVRRSKEMSRKVLEFEESRKGSAGLVDRVASLQREIRAYEDRMENIESLLDSILICLNAYDNGESQHSLHKILDAIVQEIYLYRLQGEVPQLANS